jgi:ABC-type sulfate transport system permease component
MDRPTVTELLEGGIIVTGPGFRTVVQLDGDVCVMVDAELLGKDPSELQTAWANHRRQIEATLKDMQRRIRALTTIVPLTLGSVAGFVIMLFDPRGAVVGDAMIDRAMVLPEGVAVAVALAVTARQLAKWLGV